MAGASAENAVMMLGAPWALLALPLPWLIWRFAPPHRYRARAVQIPLFRPVTKAAGLTPSEGAVVLPRARAQMAVAALVWGLLVLALAQPERLGEPITQTRAARDIVLALDLSGSMDARDFTTPDGQPQQRLAAVREVLRAFIAGRDNDRMALVVFGSRAFVQAPLTEDLTGLAGFLDQAEVGMAGPDTAIGDAIGLALRLFRASEVEERLLILLSDGADTGSRVPPATAADLAAQEGVQILTIGVGDPAGQGADRVDLAALEQVARRTGGQSFHAQDSAALDAIYARINAQTPREEEVLTHRPRLSLAHWPMGAALGLIMLTVLGLRLRHGRPGA